MYCLYRGEIVQFFLFLFLSSYSVVFVELNNVMCSLLLGFGQFSRCNRYRTYTFSFTSQI